MSHAIEERLDPRRFVPLGRGTLANTDLIARVSPMLGGTYLAKLTNGQELAVSRIQSRTLRETLLSSEIWPTQRHPQRQCSGRRG